MLTVIIKDSHEAKVIEMTYQNLWKELKDLPDTKLVIADNWLEAFKDVKTRYVCFVEADCLLSSGYFSSQLGLLKKNPMLRKIAMMTSSTAVRDWANKFYGYSVEEHWKGASTDLKRADLYIQPNKDRKSTHVYPVQVAYVPGSIIHVKMLGTLLSKLKWSGNIEEDLVKLSSELSLGFWEQGDGNRVHINPNSTYCTTEEYVNDLSFFNPSHSALLGKFEREVIS